MSVSRSKQCAVERIQAPGKFNNEESQAMLKKTFDFFDADGSGSIDAAELGRAMVDMRMQATAAQVSKIMKVIDTDQNGTVEWDEFLTFFEKCSCKEDLENLIASQHKRFFKYRESVVDADFSKIYPNPRARPVISIKEHAHNDGITAVCVLNGNKFATCSADGQVLFWKWNNGSLVELDPEIQHKQNGGPPLGVTAMCPMQDGSIMATCAGQSVYLWQADKANSLCNNTQLGEFKFDKGQQPLCLDQRGGSQLVVGLMSGEVAVLNCDDPTNIKLAFEYFSIHKTGNITFRVNSVACHGNLIASAGADSNVVVFDPVKRTTKPKNTEAMFDGIGADYSICQIKWHKDGKKLFIAGEDYTCKMVHIEAGADVQSSFLGHTNTCTTVAVSPDGERLLTGSQDGSIRTWLVNEMEIVTVNYKKAKEQREQNPGSVSDAEFKITKSIWRERSTLKCVQSIGEWMIGSGTQAIPHAGIAWGGDDWAVATDKAGNIAILDCTNLAGSGDIGLWDEHSDAGQ